MKTTASEIIKVWAVNGGTIAFITLTEAQALATILLAAVSIAYTIHKWRQDKK